MIGRLRGLGYVLGIIGIPAPSATGRRVNAGVVNIGIIPATFRFSARTRDGRTIGKSVESGVPEDQVWLVNDLEAALGVKLDETITVRVTVIAGTGVGFATIVEPSGDQAQVPTAPCSTPMRARSPPSSSSSSSWLTKPFMRACLTAIRRPTKSPNTRLSPMPSERRSAASSSTAVRCS